MCHVMPLGPTASSLILVNFTYLGTRMCFESMKCSVEKPHRATQSKDQRQKNPSPCSIVLCLSKLSMTH